MPLNSSEIKDKKSIFSRECFRKFNIKEDNGEIIVEGLIATTHPDRVGDILSKNACLQIVNYINDTSKAGDEKGAYRSVSLFHDWIHEGDPTLDEVAFIKPTAKLVDLDSGHYGVEVEAVLNKFYRGDMPLEEVKYRIDNGQIAGFSIEYNTDDKHTKSVNYNGKQYRFIDGLTEYGGTGLARARMIANPEAVIYKEIESNLQNNIPDKEVNIMEQKEE